MGYTSREVRELIAEVERLARNVNRRIKEIESRGLQWTSMYRTLEKILKNPDMSSGKSYNENIKHELRFKTSWKKATDEVLYEALYHLQRISSDKKFYKKELDEQQKVRAERFMKATGGNVSIQVMNDYLEFKKLYQYKEMNNYFDSDEVFDIFKENYELPESRPLEQVWDEFCSINAGKEFNRNDFMNFMHDKNAYIQSDNELIFNNEHSTNNTLVFDEDDEEF